MSGCACRSRAIPSPSSACATSCSIPTPMSATIPCRSIPARARASPASPPRAISPSTRKHVGVLARFQRGDLYDRRKVDDLREAMVATGLFRTVSAEPVLTGETAPRTAPNMSTSSSARTRGRRARSTPPPATRPARGFRLEATWEHRNLFPPEGALRVAGDRRHPGAESARSRFRRNNWGQRDRALLLQVEAGRPRFRRLPGLYGAALRPGLARIDADLAEALDLCLWRRARSPPTRTRPAIPPSLAHRRLFHRRADRPARLRPLEQPARSDQRLPPARPGQSRGVAAQRRRALHPQHLDGSAYYPVGDELHHRRRGSRFGSIFGADSRRARAVAAALCGRRRLGARLRLSGARAASDAKNDAARRPRPRSNSRSRAATASAITAWSRFVDAGQVYESQYPDFSDMRFGVGVGGRVYTNFGPVRVDVATPIGRRKGEVLIAVYVSIGQAF